LLILETSRVCEFSGGLYCRHCHCNWQATIPAKIIFHWDFTRHRGIVFCQLCYYTTVCLFTMKVEQ